MLSFQTNPSFENAFFVLPESKENLKYVLYVHTSVNLLHSFIPEIASASLGTSRERVKKIENLMIEMTNWLE